MKRLLSYCLMTLALCVALAGCFGRPAAVKEADETRLKAFNNYRTNTNAVHAAEQEAYREASMQTVEMFFNMDMAEIEKLTDVNGKVDASKAFALLRRAYENKDKNKAKVEAQVKRMNDLVQEADREFLVANKLDEMLGKFYDAGISAEDAQPYVNQILDMVRKK